jgi:hypothetical protein
MAGKSIRCGDPLLLAEFVIRFLNFSDRIW